MIFRPTIRRAPRRLAAIALGIAGTLLAGGIPVPASAASSAFAGWDVTQRLRDDTGTVRTMPTSGHSGLVASKTYPNIYYAHVDHPFNNGGPRIYALRLEGGVIKPVRPGVLFQEIKISGATTGNTANDWEDITIDDRGRIHIIAHNHDSVFEVTEVDPATTSSAAMVGSYAAPHGGNSETLMWHDGAMYWVDKSTPPTPANVYKKVMPDSAWQKLGPIPEPPGGFDVGAQERICGGDISDDGTRVAIVTKLNVYVYEGHNPDDALSRPPRWTIDFSSSAMESLTEGLAFVRGSHDIYIDNEAGWFKFIPAAVYSPGTGTAGPPPPGGTAPLPVTGTLPGVDGVLPVVTSGTGPAALVGVAPVPTSAATRSGYWMVTASGAVFAFGGAPFLGEPAGKLGRAVAVDLEPTPSRKGYWVADDRGGVHTYGDAASLGGLPANSLAPGESVTSLSVTSGGAGYWVFTTRGRVFAFGNAPFLGDMSGRALKGPVIDSVSTPSGQGYTMVAHDGGVFTFGDARFFGSMGGVSLRGPVQSLIPDADGTGYWLVASDGGVFAFQAPFRGSMGGKALNRPVSGMVHFGDGYLMVGEDGGIFNFSDLPFLGSLGADPPPSAVIAVAALS
jgi:hypothetical protein